MIVPDTGILSLLFRRKRRDLNSEESRLLFALEDLVKAGEIVIVGPIRQEILSGIVSPEQFQALKSRLATIDDLPMDSDTFVLAAEFFNRCRGVGVAPGHIDMMICAAAYVHSCEIFTADPDFPRYAHILPIHLYRG